MIDGTTRTLVVRYKMVNGTILDKLYPVTWIILARSNNNPTPSNLE